MRVIVVQNFWNSGLGQLGAALERAGAAIDHRMVHEGEPLPTDASAHDAMVVLGGAQNALDDESSPYFPALLDLIRAFEAQDRAVLGICLGAQLVARAFGAQNHIGTAPEFGWREVALTPEGEADPVLGGLPARFPIFQWHDDTFDLPAGAVRLARNEAVGNQAFRVGRAAYGVQFHFEADRPMVRRWSADLADYLAERQPGWAGRMEADAATLGVAADRAGAALACAWISQV
ncbi:MAG TPA: type 1 glutamine amidotransferase [Mesorhizobium sp.]|jgi:GMP synthase-like glutamine amidotransferase|nr:type 1 glutamine amidotransferase [Mesorhizobium sp.]